MVLRLHRFWIPLPAPDLAAPRAVRPHSRRRRLLATAWLLLTALLCAWMARPAAAAPPSPTLLDVPLTVKENVGVAIANYPVSAVIPLPQGAYTNPLQLGMAGVPSQVEVLERWPGDNSLRHVQVHFQAAVPANGAVVYHFGDGGPLAPAEPVSLIQAGAALTITTGPLRLRLNTAAFNLFDAVWFDANGNRIYEAGEQIVAPHGQNGGVFTPRAGAGAVQYDAGRNDLAVTIEQSGPLVVVVRVEAPARFVSTTNHLHGFAARIYAYAGQAMLKVDYQLQNSDKTVVRSWPLYFESQRLDLRLALQGNPTLRFGLGNGSVHTRSRGSGAYLAQEMHDRFAIYSQPGPTQVYSATLPAGTGPEGFLDISDSQVGVTAAIRNFWQTWPNGLAVDGQNRLSLELWPAWSAHWLSFLYTQNAQSGFSPSGLYWLDDMQHYLKETQFWFHGPGAANATLLGLARTWQFPPVTVVPTDWYRQTHATADLGGVIPPAVAIPPADDRRLPFYNTPGYDPEDWYDPQSAYYGAGWINFWDPEPGYRSVACTAGGWPYAATHLIATGNPGDFFEAADHGQSELNLRPEWLTGYTHDADWPQLQLSENPYCGGRWRIYEGSVSPLAAPPLPDTVGDYPVYRARDDQHGWTYHVADAYWLTGNPWIRDWYRFVAEFRRVRLAQLDPFPDNNSRARGHSLNQVVQAARVAGDVTQLDRLRTHLLTTLRPDQDRFYGDQRPETGESGGGFQTGYLMRMVVDYLEEMRARGDWQAYAEGFNYLSGLVAWNYNFGNFPYYFDARGGGVGVSNGTSLTLVDPVAWYYWHSGRQPILTHLNQYVTGGINGGEPPYGEFNAWSGQFESRYYLFVKHTVRPDSTPPPAIGDLVAQSLTGTVRLLWTAPTDAVRYHIVWSDRPLVEPNSLSPAVMNWWAAHAVGPTLTATPGQRQMWTIATGATTPVYAAIFSFDAQDNLSAMSNVALAAPPVPCLADIDDNGLIDLLDVMLVAGSWGTASGQPGYVARHDMNSDGLIDIWDVQYVAARFNQTCTGTQTRH